MPIRTQAEETMVEEEMMLQKLLAVADEDDDILQWCFQVMKEEDIASCLSEAKKIAAAHHRGLTRSDWIRMSIRKALRADNLPSRRKQIEAL